MLCLYQSVFFKGKFRVGQLHWCFIFCLPWLSQPPIQPICHFGAKFHISWLDFHPQTYFLGWYPPAWSDVGELSTPARLSTMETIHWMVWIWIISLVFGPRPSKTSVQGASGSPTSSFKEDSVSPNTVFFVLSPCRYPYMVGIWGLYEPLHKHRVV